MERTAGQTRDRTVWFKRPADQVYLSPLRVSVPKRARRSLFPEKMPAVWRPYGETAQR